MGMNRPDIHVGIVHMQTSIKFQRDLIAMESFSGPTALANAVRQMPEFLQNARSYIQQFLSAPATATFDKRGLEEATRRLAPSSYSALRPLPYPIPPGLRVGYLEYADALYASGVAIHDIQKTAIDPFTSWLRKKLGDPKSLLSNTTAFSFDETQPRAVERALKNMDNMFNKNGIVESSAEYGRVVRRNEDWHAVGKMVQSTVELFSEAQQKALVRSVDDLNATLQKLFDRIEQDPDEYKVSGGTIKAIATTTYEIARLVEQYALIRGKLHELVKAIEECRVKLAAATK